MSHTKPSFASRFISCQHVVFRCALLSIALLSLSAGCGGSQSPPDALLELAQPNQATRRLIQGQVVTGDAYSSTIMMIGVNPDEARDGRHQAGLCSGVRIRPDVILTAAHCFTDSIARGMKSFVVTSVLAPLDPAATQPLAGRVNTVVDFAIPANYKYNGLHMYADADIALGFLSQSEADDDMVEPAVDDGLDEPDSGQDLYSVAYGINEQTWFADRGVGIKRIADFYAQSVTPTIITVGGAEANACMGDSGAPLFSRDNPGVVVGIFSQTYANLFRFCKSPSVWTRVQAFEPWIQSELDERCKLGLRSEAVCAARP